MFKQLNYALLLLLPVVGCNSGATATVSGARNTPAVKTVTAQVAPMPAKNSPLGFDSTYMVSETHRPFMITGMFNTDAIPDTALLIKHKITGKDALFIRHGGTAESFLLKNGSDAGTDFEDFNWVERFEVEKKGTKIWENVIDGEIVGEDQVPDSLKITLVTDAIFVHLEEACGGGYLYFKDGKYVWVQQD